jgi:hypothetical protein
LADDGTVDDALNGSTGGGLTHKVRVLERADRGLSVLSCANFDA